MAQLTLLDIVRRWPTTKFKIVAESGIGNSYLTELATLFQRLPTFSTMPDVYMALAALPDIA